MEIRVSDFDLVKSDKKTIDTQKVLLKMWEYKKNTEIISELANILSKFVDEKRVFADIEFFLPQIAHLTIHLDHAAKIESLEYLLILIAQTSMHAALQLCFIFSAALEDFQPELSGGQPNPANNPFLFRRCARLLEDIERAVIYGSPSIGASEAKRDEVASTLSRMKSSIDGQLCGDLFYKRLERKSTFHSKTWKSRYFVVDKRVLLCYHDPYAVNPVRSVHLQNARVVECDPHPKYGDTVFEVVNESTNSRFLLRAADATSRRKWINVLQSQINGAPPVLVADASEKAEKEEWSKASEKSVIPAIPMDAMTPIQRKRFSYFRQLRIFITNMTNICEKLRFKDRPLRKFYLKHDMGELVLPPFVYIPLCSSLDSYRTILRSLPKECYAFNTKARCPALMMYEVEEHPEHIDLATFLGLELERYSESDVVQDRFEVVQFTESSPDNIAVDENAESVHGGDTQVEKRPTRFGGFLGKGQDMWKEEGTGLKRCQDAGITINLSIGKAEKEGAATDNPLPHQSHSVHSPLGESYEEKGIRLRGTSPYGHLPTFQIGGLIAKSNDDVRQEVFVMQMIQYFQNTFQKRNVPVWLHSYRILSTSKTTGLIELIPNSSSFDGLKKKSDYPGSLRSWFERSFEYGTNNEKFNQAMEAYVSSMAAYSIVTFLLAIKDRHNGNIMLDKDGHVIHIDFGFVFGLAPGKQASMEKAPWKLNKEMVDVMGGTDSEFFKQYKQRCIEAFTIARQHSREAINLVEIMQYHSNFPAFRYNGNALRDFRNRFYLDAPDSNIPKIVEGLLKKSYKHVGSDFYDSFQLATNGIAK